MARFLVGPIVAAIVAFMSPASAQSLPPEIGNGVAWLNAQIQPDGSLAGEAGSIALPLQSESETVHALARMGNVPSAVVARLAADESALSEWRARKATSLAIAGQGASAPLAALVSSRNPDGGFGARSAYASNPLDTAYALQAMAIAGSNDTQVAATAFSYLLSVRHADGSWGIDDQGSVHVTAQVLIAAQAWATRLAVAPVAAPAHDWLIAQRNAGLRFGSVLDDAVALIALSTHSADQGVLQPLADGLRGAQAANGSWADDPYLTALALRALWSLSSEPPQPSTASLAGRVIDAASGASLEGVTVQRADDPSAITMSSADGSFRLSALAPGSFQVQLSRAGYSTLSIDVQLVAGDTLQLGTLQLQPAPLTAVLSGVVRTNTGAALSGAIVSVGTASVMTDAAGSYLLNGLDVGVATIQAAKPGYRTVTAEATFEAGGHYSFSPTLYPNSTTPPATATLRGGVVDSGTGQPVAGAIVELGSATTTTGANGRFELTGLGAGSFALSIHAGGYQPVSATGTLANGINDVGNIPLSRVPETSTISGMISDADSGAPVAGASLVVEGQSATGVSGADGRYVIDGISGTQFALLVTAPGYLGGRFPVALPQPGHGTLDLQLVAAQASGLLIDEARMSKPVYGPSEELELEVEVRNTSDTSAELVIDADVRDPSGNIVHVFKANVQGAGQFPPNLPLTFPPASSTEVEMEWAAQRLAAGSYSVHVRGSDATGRVLAEGSTQFTVRSEPALRGGVIADPPLAQAGTDVPVHLSADLLNVGNEPVPAGALKLSIVLQNADNDSSTVPQVGVTALLSGAPYANPRGGLLRDSNGNLLSVNQSDRKLLRMDPQTLAVTVLATVPDQPAGIAIDVDDRVWIASGARRITSVDTAGLVTSFNAARVTTLTGIDVDASGNLVLSGRFSGTENGSSINEQRLVLRAPDGTETVLWRNGLSQPIAMVKDDAGNYIVSNYGDSTLSRVTQQGEVTPFATGFDRPQGITRDSVGNLYVANSGNGTVSKVTPAGAPATWASGFVQPMDLRLDDTGNLFVSNQGDDSIIRVAPDGQQQVFARGIANRPEGMAYDAAGNLYIANGDGTLRVKAWDGTSRTIAAGLSGPRGLALREDSAVLVANYNDGTVAKVDGSGKSVFATGLANPYGVAVDDLGRAHVTEHGAHRIRSLDANGDPAGTIESLLVNPADVALDAQGRMFIASSNFITVIEAGTPRVMVTNFAAASMSVDPVGGGVLALRGRELYRIGLDGSTTLLATLAFTPYNAVANATGDVIIRDYSGRRLHKVDAAGNVSVLAELSTYPADLTAGLDGNVYVLLNDHRTIHRVGSDGTLVQVAHPLTEYMYGIRADATGQILTWTNYSRVHAIDPVAGTVVRLLNDVRPNSVARDAGGLLTLSFSTSQEIDTYDASGAVVSRLDGFVNPWDIVWDGSALHFVDNGGRFYVMTPGGYPVKQGTFNVSYLAKAGADILGTASGKIVRWNGNAAVAHAGVTGATLRSVAGRADGRFAGADNAASRVLEFDAARQVTADHAGIVRPQGLAFDAQGRLHVANYGSGTVARIDANGVASTVATVASPRYLAFDADDNLWITHSGAVTRVTPAGTAGTVGSAVNAMGMLIDGSEALVVDQSLSQLRRLSGTEWRAFASGLSNPTAVRAGPGDVVYVANRSSNAVLAYRNGQLGTVAVNLAGINSLALSGDGALYAARDSGLIDRIDADGSVDTLPVRSALGQAAVHGLVEAAQGQLFAIAGGGALYRVTISQAPTPPAPGTVVHTAQVPMAAMPPGEVHEHFDFGDWLPPYGGDFRVVVEREGIDAPAVNHIHVGPHATGLLTAGASELPPGDQTLPMCLNLSGADFTSISRVEVDQVRRLAAITWPNGMAADRAGNVYYTNGGNLFRTDVEGNATTVLTGLATAFGLAADSNENLYFANRNASTGRYELVRVDPAGTRSTVVDLGVTRANGVAVDSRDNILVGGQGKLFKVTQDGVLSVVTTSGIPNPRGIAIDGRDNVYVQNDPGYVSMIRPDGSVTDLYTRNNGVEDPYFEGDGYPNIAADCADNLYVASFRWDAMGVAAREEHMIAQIVARTGQAAVLFDTLNVNSIINDIDYLAFDRFGSRLMMYNDYERMIWQVPVTCGAIGVDAHVFTAPGQSLTATTRAPAAVIPQADGRTEYVWSLRDVTADGASVCWDTGLADLQLGELRKSVDSGFISFHNSFSPQDVTLPLEVPLIQVTNLVSLSVATDRAEYQAFDDAQVTTTLVNQNPMVVDGVLTVEVKDALGVLVARVQQDDVSLPSGESLPIGGLFPVGSILPGPYVIHAALSDNGRTLAEAESSFVVLADDAQGLATSQVATDKQIYQPSDRVQISSRVTSLSSNVILENLALMVQVRDGSGTLLFTQGHPLNQLLPGSTRDFVSVQLLQNAAPGTYLVHQELVDAAAHVLDTREVTYQVGSSGDNGFGLAGSLSADPVEIAIGEPVQLSATVTNSGNADLAAVPLQLAVIDPDDEVVHWTWSTTADIAIGATVPVVQVWDSGAAPVGTYIAVLKATVGGVERVLATTTIDVIEQAAVLDATVSMNATPVLSALALVDADMPSAQRMRLHAALGTLGYAGTMVETAGEFDTGLRSGTFQLYLLLGDAAVLDGATQRLLREAVHRGEGLLVAHGGAVLSETIAQLAGLVRSGALTSIPADAVTIDAASPGGPARAELVPPFPARLVETTDALVQAELEGRFGDVPDIRTLAEALATDLQIAIHYAGSDAGVGGSRLDLVAPGRLRNEDGSDRHTVWQVRNSGDTARVLELRSGDGRWSLTLSSAPHSDLFVASPVVTGDAPHALYEGGALVRSLPSPAVVFSDARLVDAGSNPGAIALWANSIDEQYGLEWAGSQHQSHGAVHSNSGIRWTGAQNLVDGPVHVVGEFRNSGSQNTFTLTPRVVTPQPLPRLLDIEDYRPGGPVQAALGSAYLDQTAECQQKGRWKRNGSNITLASGVYWIPCDVQLSGSRFNGNVTLVSTGSVQFSGSSATFQPFHQGVQIATSRVGAQAVKLATSSLTIGGLVYAPSGEIEATGSSSWFGCALVADTIRLAGSRITIDAGHCGVAGIERRAPAVTWHRFGEGWTAYAAFDWSALLAQSEPAGVGPVGQLFEATLDHIAPDSLDLRAGAIVPVQVNVQNRADVFQGTLRVDAQGDAAIVVPGVPEWLLDFSQSTTFATTAMVELGSGNSTLLSARVAAQVPLVVDPLAETTISIDQLPGETLAALVADLLTTGDRDAPLDVALGALQLVQIAIDAGDREAAISGLLDAAEWSGRSTHAAAVTIRTRIDWQLWREGR